MDYKFTYLFTGIIIGFFLNFVIYTYSSEKFYLKNLYCINWIKNYKKAITVSILNGLLYMIASSIFDISSTTFFIYMLISVLLCLAIIDIKTFIVPDSLNILIFIIAIIHIVINKDGYMYHIIGAFAVSVPFFIISLFTGGIGGGDIKLFFVVGLFLGAFHILLAMFIACVLASIIGILLKLIKKVYVIDGKEALAFVPYICIGSIISILYGDIIFIWYIDRFFPY